MAGEVRRLRLSRAARDKLGRRGIDRAEVRQLLANAGGVMRNPQAPPEAPDRRLLVGLTDGGRALALVIEPTGEVGEWTVITGWEATRQQRRMVGL